ncbi:MAG: FmdB family zinc ribbon protein [Dehalococcoidia bacterium]
MPIYEYACQSGGHRFEVKQSFSDDPLTVCQECGAPVKRVIFPAGIVFKGSGFYKTDSVNGSRSESSTPETSSEKSSTETPATPAAAPAGESKPEAKAEVS